MIAPRRGEVKGFVARAKRQRAAAQTASFPVDSRDRVCQDECMPARSLYELTLDDLVAWFAARGEPRFRARQVFEWAYRRNATDFYEMTNLPRELRSALAETFSLGPPPVEAVTEGGGTAKLLLALPAGGRVECVRIRMGAAYTACLSTQVGCAIRCAFCATGQTGCERNLSVGEIIAQLIALRALPSGQGDDLPRVSNVVFMGMGEPFHNYEATVAAVRTLAHKRAFGMSPSRITVATAGVAPMIRRYAKDGLATELAVSLNAPDDDLRRRLMPGVARWPLEEVLAACREFSAATGGQPVTFTYVLIEGVNDLLDHARALAQLLRRQPHHLNIIPLNPVHHTDLRAPGRERTNAFVHHCRKFGLNVSLRHSKGAQIDAACGQLRARRAGRPRDAGE